VTYGVTPDVAIGNDSFENSSLTIAVVETASLSGTSVSGAEVVRDALGVTDGGAADSFFFGAPVFGPDGTFFPAGARRVDDGVDTDAVGDWELADFNLGALNTPTPSTPLGNQPVQADCGGGGLTVLEGTAATRDVSASDIDGTVTQLTLHVAPATAGISFEDVVAATEVGGTATGTVTIAATTEVGSYEVEVTGTNDDAAPQSGSCTFTVTVTPILTVGEVQGRVADDDNPLSHASPFAGQQVWVRGVITQRVRFATGASSQVYGFFLQSATDDTDGFADSSDGIFVWHDRFTTLLREGTGSYVPQVGDEVVLRGPVEEDFNQTRLRNPRLVEVLPDRGATVAMTEAAPPDDLLAANLFWERHEGMRFHLDADAHVVAARDVFASTFDGEVWVIRGDHPIANRADPYTRLVYRDTHPLDDVGPAGSWDNGNGMRIMLQSHGLKWAQGNNRVMIAPARTFDTVTNELTGGLYFAFGKYGIEIESDLALEHGADPAGNAPPAPAVTGEEFSTSDFNVENLYDFRDDPHDGCDFAGDPGCDGVSPPFDYVPASQAAYEQHLADLAAQIAGPMHAPDLLMIQEAEDQDICWIDGDELACGDADDADGRPDTLQDLALAISAAGGPTYDAALDRDGADDRGIVSAFLFRTDTVELLAASADDPILGDDPDIGYAGGLAYNADIQNPKAFNAELPAGLELGDACDELANGRCVYTRDPQVGHFRVWRDGIGSSVFTEVWAISNHFSSTPDRRVEQRTEQAAYNAALAEAIVAADAGARVISGGDFNVFPRPDDPFAPGHPLHPSDQLGPMYDAGLHNLWDVLVEEVPQSAYSYSFVGMVQTLDSQWANDPQFADLAEVRVAHLNADFAADYDGDVARGASDHDPQLARWNTDVTFDRLHALVAYYAANGDLDDAWRFHSRLDRAQGYLDEGHLSAARAQLQAFGNQAYDFAAADVAAALEKEGDRLAGML
jgi:predicted extracellular nuclease